MFIPTFCEKYIFIYMFGEKSFFQTYQNYVYWFTPKTIFLIRKESLLYFSTQQANLDHATFNGDFGNVVSKLNWLIRDDFCRERQKPNIISNWLSTLIMIKIIFPTFFLFSYIYSCTLNTFKFLLSMRTCTNWDVPRFLFSGPHPSEEIR